MNAWVCPLMNWILVPTQDAGSFNQFPEFHTGLPIGAHPGAFGVVRKNHTHEGVDLYVPSGTLVQPVEKGIVVHIEAFTGEHAQTPWWHNTWAVFVEGPSGVVVYGEIEPAGILKIGDQVDPKVSILGQVIPVLKKDKGRPGCMLHLELHTKGARQAPAWEGDRPSTLLDPTAYLKNISKKL